MTQQTLSQEGAFTNDQRKQINENFDELYTLVGAGNFAVSAESLEVADTTELNGAVTLADTVLLEGDMTVADGIAIKTSTTDTQTMVMQAYDVNGTAYKTFLTLTNANTPSMAIAAPSGGAVTIDGATIGGTTPAAGTFTYAMTSRGNALTAAGSTRADALQLAATVNNITTAAASTGVILPVGVVGMEIWVYNNGANSVQVYASASETINGTAGATGVALANAKVAVYHFMAANTWVGATLN
jgi:hypothetical protein